jgi:HEAT repeat protein
MGLFSNRRPRVERMSRKGDVEGLCRALGYRDRVALRDGESADVGAPVRREALQALHEAEGEGVVEAVAAALAEDDDAGVRVEAGRALRAQRATGAMVDALVRPHDELPVEARAELESGLREAEDPSLGGLFAERLIADGGDPGDGERDLLEKLISRAQEDSRLAVASASVSELATEDPGRRERAVFVLSCLGSAGTEALRDALDQPRRAQAAWALGRLRDSAALPDLMALLEDDEPPVRAAAARALGTIRDPRAVEALLRASTDEEFVVRDASLEAIDQLGTAAVAFAVAVFVQPLIKAGAATSQADSAPSLAAKGAGDAKFEGQSAAALGMGSGQSRTSAPTGGALDRLRSAARRARARRQRS